ncbi:MAG: ABC transporter permease [Pseudomonadota bacterium]
MQVPPSVPASSPKHTHHGSGLDLRAIMLGAALLGCAAGSQASSCGPLANGYGPFDYVTQKSQIGVVEQHHFTPRVEALVGGATSTHVGEDIDYTLKASPNHHRALLSLVRLGKKTKSTQPVGLAYSVECYFERALRFRPADSVVRMIYARYLFQDQRATQANQQLEQTVATAGDDPFVHYNVGLLYLEHENYPLALAHAHKAYALGFSQTALRDRLQLLGRWKEPG